MQLQGGVHDGLGLTCMDFVASVVRSQVTAEDTLASLREAFVELDPEYGVLVCREVNTFYFFGVELSNPQS